MTEQTPPPAYFGSLTIRDVKCFKGEQTIDLSDGHGKPALWTVILGNNNTGKTTLLRCLADLEPKVYDDIIEKKTLVPKGHGKYKKPEKWWMLEDAFIEKTIYRIDSSILLKINGEQYGWYEKDWWYSSGSAVGVDFLEIGNLIIYGYGTSRKMGNSSLSETENQDNTASLFDTKVTLINAEEWLIQTDYASKNGIESAKFRLEKIKEVLVNGLLPDAKNIKCTTEEINGKINNFVEVETDYGWVKLRELGYGYQVTLAWVVDLAKKLFERYPNSENPLHEPAIVLVDEIDLHLHPEWQRKIIKFLSEQFPSTQFIATTHSPLIVQSAENINLVLLEKDEDHVMIRQPDLTTYKGWTVEEILSDLMGLEGKTKSEDYLSLIKEFNKAVAKNNYSQAKQIYDKLDILLHPNNIHRELLSLQLNALSQEAA